MLPDPRESLSASINHIVEQNNNFSLLEVQLKQVCEIIHTNFTAKKQGIATSVMISLTRSIYSPCQSCRITV